VRDGQLRITVKALGDHSRALADLTPGSRVVTEGPYGAMTPATRRRRKVLLIAGGAGITPTRTLFQSMPAAPGELTLIYRASNDDDVVFRDELESLADQSQANLHIITGRRGELARGPLCTAALTGTLPDLLDHDVYLCGPLGMTKAAKQSLREAGVPHRHIHHESFEL